MTGEKMVKICLLALSGILFPLLSIAQFNDNGQTTSSPATNDKFYKYSVQAGAEITYAISDPAMVKVFPNGVYASNVAFDASVTRRVYVGAEIHDDEFSQVNPLYGTSNPNMFLYTGGLRLGYHSSISNDFLFNASLTGGESLIKFTASPIDAPSVKSPVWFLNIMEGYKLADQFWIGLNVSLTYLTYTFNPYYIGDNTFPWLPSDYHGITTYFGWGFQLYYTFSKK
ncbi:MAG: hypothetical protein ACLQQ4_11275 [Bacteroidia bacterium]